MDNSDNHHVASQIWQKLQYVQYGLIGNANVRARIIVFPFLEEVENKLHVVSSLVALMTWHSFYRA